MSDSLPQEAIATGMRARTVSSTPEETVAQTATSRVEEAAAATTEAAAAVRERLVIIALEFVGGRRRGLSRFLPAPAVAEAPGSLKDPPCTYRASKAGLRLATVRLSSPGKYYIVYNYPHDTIVAWPSKHIATPDPFVPPGS
jgi:hypothetical protein